MIADVYIDELNRTDFMKMSLEEAKEKFIELTYLYDFPGKGEEYREAVKRKTSQLQITKFAWNVALAGMDKKVKSFSKKS